MSAPGRERERGDATLGQRTGTHTSKAITAFLDNYSQTNQRPKFVPMESGKESYLISSPEWLGNHSHYWLGGETRQPWHRVQWTFSYFYSFLFFFLFPFFYAILRSSTFQPRFFFLLGLACCREVLVQSPMANLVRLLSHQHRSLSFSRLLASGIEDSKINDW